MIKGHVCIDLHNHNSGFTERIEKDNMVTDAIAKLVVPVGLTTNTVHPEKLFEGQTSLYNNQTNSALFPLATVGLGGIMLFDGKLKEDVSNVQFPTDVHLIGYGGSGTNTADSLKGSRNWKESKPLDDLGGYTTVWDFATNQANGKIASVALTHVMMADRGFGCSLLNFNTGNSWKRKAALHWDKSNHKLYWAHVGEYSATKGIKINIYRGNNYLESIDVCKTYRNTSLQGSELVASYSFDKLVKDSRQNAFFGVCEGYLYMIDFEYNSTHSCIMHRCKVADLVSNTNASWETRKLSISDNVRLNSWLIIRKNKLYMPKSDNDHALYVCDLSSNSNTFVKGDSSDIVVANVPYKSLDEDTILNRNGILIYKNKNSKWNALYPDDTIISCNASNQTFDGYQCQYSLAEDMPIYSSNLMYDGLGDDAAGIRVSNSYLGTICNLDETITKTESTSMKVTYTLSNA